jgi:EAL domain-containing protein (putative c-di-GMP-specific phosphodiesterase class I)
VLDQALADLSARLARSSLPEHFRTWVKVAPSLMADPAFVGTVDELTAKHEVAASRLGLDIREPSPAAVASTAATLSALLERDVVVSLDGFGAGPSNLALLQRLPITGLKLASELVATLGDPAVDNPIVGRPPADDAAADDPAADDPAADDAAADDPAVVDPAGGDLAGREGANLVGALIELAHALEFSVVAEGVETEAQLGLLRALGCEYAQGPLFNRGAPIEMAPDTSQEAPNENENENEIAPTPGAGPADTATNAPTETAPGGGVAPGPPAESLWAAGTMPAAPNLGVPTSAHLEP